MLRHEVAEGTDLGRQAKEFIDSGRLVPDELIIDLVVPRVLAAAAGPGYVLDGFPRSTRQAVEARRIAAQYGFELLLAINLDAPPAQLVQRILHRAALEGRSDDTEEVISERLRVFSEATAPLLDFYAGRGLLHTVDAMQSPDEVTHDVIDAVLAAAAAAETTTDPVDSG